MQDIVAVQEQLAEMVYILADGHLRGRCIGALADMLIKLFDRHRLSEVVGIGLTVDKKMSPIKKSYYDGSEELIAVDLPGAYSMSPFTSEESVTSAYIKGENPDVIINIVDATNLSRSLFFTTQL